MATFVKEFKLNQEGISRTDPAVSHNWMDYWVPHTNNPFVALSDSCIGSDWLLTLSPALSLQN